MKKIGLFFGTFNPIHVGHLILAEYLQVRTDLDEVWLVVTPHNPFKNRSNLLPDRERLHLVNLALEGHEHLRSSDIEFGLPQPNYTAQTLAYLREKHPELDFSIIMGEDNLRTMYKWRNVESILENHRILAYPRHTDMPAEEMEKLLQNYTNVELVDAPKIEISATLIRKSFVEGKPLKNLLPKVVFDYIDGSNMFQ
jgi:nicotinate-nucleotide adenylyltransferase